MGDASAVALLTANGARIAFAEAVDTNFAVHLPVLDRLFGTYYRARGRWPAAHGLDGGCGLETRSSSSTPWPRTPG
jgi:sterol desaturase/sphingolipid hydroxylase (fatty acid hydroxylase superfamily)